MTNFRAALVAFVVAAAFCAGSLRAADWPQVRGPERNGVVLQSPALLDSFGKDGPKKLWTSDNIPCGSNSGGWSSIAVASGKIYVYANQNIAKKWRLITADMLASEGYSPDMPADLSAKVEQARTSSERKAIKDNKAITLWIKQWIKDNTTDDQAKFKDAITARLRKGAAAIRLDLLPKLAPIVDKKFDSEADLVKWLKESPIEAAAHASIIALATPRDKDAFDSLYCLDAATGKMIWTTPFGAAHFDFPASSTPTVVDGKVYILGSAGSIFCFDAASGKSLWQSPNICKDSNHHARASSVLVAEGLAVATTDSGTYAISLSDPQKIVWTLPKFSSEVASDSVWTHAGKTYFLLFSGVLVNPSDGQIVASAKGGHFCTPAIVGDYAALPGPEKAGIFAYKLAADKVDLLWSTYYAADEFSCPLIDGDYVYAIGGGYDTKGDRGKAACLDLKTGKILWEEKLPLAQHSSPVLADGKIFAVVGPELVVFKATPEKFDLLGRADLGLEKWCSPAITGTQLFLRTTKNIICLDLSKS